MFAFIETAKLEIIFVHLHDFSLFFVPNGKISYGMLEIIIWINNYLDKL